jgi:pimeloyl-ACP methyl ester carboxylesterase
MEDLRQINRPAAGAPPRSHRVRVGSLELHYVEWGDAAKPAVVLVHGAGAHARWWDALVPALVHEHRLVAPDLRGHGESDWAVPARYPIEDFAADVLALLDALGIASAALVGHSMGGRVGLWLAAHHPERVRAVALLDVRVRGLKRERVDRWRGTAAGERPRRVYPTFEEAAASFRLTPEEPGVAPDVLRALAAHAVRERAPGEWSLSFDRRVLALDGSRLSDFGPLLERVRCPALVMKGAASTVIGDEQAEETARALRAGPVRTFAGGHHFLLADPTAVAEALREFLAENR